MEWHRLALGKRFILALTLAWVGVFSLSSCSLWQSWFGSDSDIKIKRPSTCSPFEPTCTSQGPYSQVKLDTPLYEVSQPKLYVIKGERRLLVVDHDVLVRDYKIGLGPRTFGDKSYQGDGRTPEGQFFICVKNPNSRFYKSLGLSYPAPHHAEKALLAGEITLEEYHQILDANANRTRPPWNTALGGEIFIHGGGAQDDWTLGCVAVYDRAMDELFNMVPVGTPVQILP